MDAERCQPEASEWIPLEVTQVKFQRGAVPGCQSLACGVLEHLITQPADDSCGDQYVVTVLVQVQQFDLERLSGGV
jgi:hypothetical protein